MKAGYNVFEVKIIQYISEKELLFLNKIKPRLNFKIKNRNIFFKNSREKW